MSFWPSPNFGSVLVNVIFPTKRHLKVQNQKKSVWYIDVNSIFKKLPLLQPLLFVHEFCGSHLRPVKLSLKRKNYISTSQFRSNGIPENDVQKEHANGNRQAIQHTSTYNHHTGCALTDPVNTNKLSFIRGHDRVVVHQELELSPVCEKWEIGRSCR